LKDKSTLGALLDPAHGLYRKAALNISGVAAALDLRADLGYLARPVPPMERFIDLSYYHEALSVAQGKNSHRLGQRARSIGSSARTKLSSRFVDTFISLP
jgi:hypothetical protein